MRQMKPTHGKNSIPISERSCLPQLFPRASRKVSQPISLFGISAFSFFVCPLSITRSVCYFLFLIFLFVCLSLYHFLCPHLSLSVSVSPPSPRYTTLTSLIASVFHPYTSISLHLYLVLLSHYLYTDLTGCQQIFPSNIFFKSYILSKEILSNARNMLWVWWNMFSGERKTLVIKNTNLHTVSTGRKSRITCLGAAGFVMHNHDYGWAWPQPLHCWTRTPLDTGGEEYLLCPVFVWCAL